MVRLNQGGAILSSTVSFVALSLGIVAGPALAQTTPSAQSTEPLPQEAAGAAETPPAGGQQGQDIVVTGFRASLNSALNEKRNETAAVDSIVAEDIGKFPDSNLAESMQRIPGVALSRGDGGEGRSISVRGLGAGFTRVRINGMEGSSQSGGSDIYGAGNSGRSFDFNVFPTEIFSRLSVRKTPSADVEEGSLGATVDLQAPHPLDLPKDFTLSVTGRGIYNQLSKAVDPRASALVAKKFDNGRWGVLASVAYQRRNIREVGYSAVDILSANSNGLAQPIPGSDPTKGIVFPYCTPVGGFVVDGVNYQSPLDGTSIGGQNIGADANNCSTGNPRTSTQEAFNTIWNLRRADMPDVGGSGAFLPRMPRYVNSEQDTKRIGGTLTLQFVPDDDTDISLDLLYSRYKVERRDNYIAGLSFARSITNQGQPTVSVRDIQFNDKGSMVYGLFDGVDVRSEGLVDDFSTTFKQANLNFRHQFNDTLEITALFGMNKSTFDGGKRLQTFMDAIDVDNFSVDYRGGGSTPIIDFGIDPADPANFSYAPTKANGTVLGGYSFQGRPSSRTTKNLTADVNTDWTLADGFKTKVGGQFRSSDYRSVGLRPYSADLVVQPLPAGTSLESITRTIRGVDDLFGAGAPSSWLAIDPNKWASTFDFDGVRYCGVECGGSSSRVREEVASAYIMETFDLNDALSLPIRGDAGVRYVHTDMLTSGFIPVAPPPGETSPTGVVGQYAVVTRSYDDWLPSANVVIEPIHNLLLRLSAAKVMSRPELGNLTPTSGITATTRTGTINNPFLDPIRADTFDAAVEWYFSRGSLLSVAYFHKDIKTFVQRVSSQVPFSELGLPAALLDNTNTAPSEVFTVSQPVNTPGGPLNGIEVNLQAQLRFLPGFLGNFGVLANYTHVTSKIQYILASAGGVPTVTTTADLIDLSKNTASGTIFYEDGRFSIRATANYRDRYIRGIPASPGSDLQGNAPTTFVDASASYNLTDYVKIILEAQNLTDERNTLYIDSQRQDTLFETRTGRTFTFGASFQF